MIPVVTLITSILLVCLYNIQTQEILYTFCAPSKLHSIDEIYRLFTGPFFHMGLFHLIPNVFGMAIFSIRFEMVLGSYHFFWLQNFLVVLTTIANILLIYTIKVFLPFNDYCSIGISGSIYALMVLEVELFSHVPFQDDIDRAFPWILMCILQAATPYFSGMHVSFEAHLSGCIVGFFLSWPLQKYILKKKIKNNMFGSSFRSSS
jgi:membrane associated rhomboid family serine protease